MLYQYFKPDSFDILEHTRIRISRLNFVNDKHEIKFCLNIKSAKKNIEKESKLDSPFVKRSQIQNIIRNYKRAFKKLRSHYHKTMGFICLTTSFNNNRMWERYAADHTGFVIAYDRRKLCPIKLAILNIRYADKSIPLPITTHRKTFDSSILRHMPVIIRAKQTLWSYEDERRMYVSLKSPDRVNPTYYYYDMKPEVIRALYIGKNASADTCNKAKAILNDTRYRHVAIYLMRELGGQLTPEIKS